MAASHVETASNNGLGATTGSVTFLGAIAQGAMLTAVVELGNSSGGFTAQNGYALVAGVIGQFAMLWKIAGAGESLTQSPCTWANTRDWRLSIAHHTPGANTAASHDVSNSVAAATSPQDLAAINPSDNIDTVMVGGVGNDVQRTYSGQTIGGVAATELADGSNGSNAAVSVFDRVNVNTSTSTFAAQATASGTPSNGGIGLVIYKLTPIDLFVSPAAAIAKAAAVSPTVIQGALSITPAYAAAKALALDPTVIQGPLVLIPAHAEAKAVALSPTVNITDMVIIPDAAAARALVVDPTVVLGSLVLLPAFAVARTGAVSPVVLILDPDAGIGYLVSTESVVGGLLVSLEVQGGLESQLTPVGGLTVTVTPGVHP